jgi:hypothetical protein
MTTLFFNRPVGVSTPTNSSRQVDEFLDGLGLPRPEILGGITKW